MGGQGLFKAILVFLAWQAVTTPVDLKWEHLGPAVEFHANTPKGEKYLKALPVKYRAVYEKPAGKRAEYNEVYKSLLVSPTWAHAVRKDAGAEGLTVKELER